MDIAVKAVDFIRSRAWNHRLFWKFLSNERRILWDSFLYRDYIAVLWDNFTILGNASLYFWTQKEIHASTLVTPNGWTIFPSGLQAEWAEREVTRKRKSDSILGEWGAALP